MEGIVAKRCLRESRLGGEYKERNRVFNKKDSFNNLYRKNLLASKRINKEENAQKSFIDKIVFRIKMKLWIQSITAMCLIIVIIACSMINVYLIDNNRYVKKLKSEYKKNYDLNSIKIKGINILKYCYNGILKIIPDKIENSIKVIYSDVKNKVRQDKPVNSVNIYIEPSKSESVRNEVNEVDKNLGIGASVDEKVEYQQAVSTISSQDSYIQYANDNNIKFVMPAKGTITSNFGARERIFPDIDAYHTGIDIANKKGTDIVASHDGKITKVSSNKYNGNFIEITNGKVTTKYIHLDSVSVKQGAKVKAGDRIGKMGETGYATGPHLHFEVVIDEVKIDPKKVLDV